MYPKSWHAKRFVSYEKNWDDPYVVKCRESGSQPNGSPAHAEAMSLSFMVGAIVYIHALPGRIQLR